MRALTTQGQQLMEDLAHRYGVSTDAAMNLLQALYVGNGTMAQFNHPDLGGSGQWMQGGMTMVSDLFNNALKAKVDGLCSELSTLLAKQAVLAGPVSSQSQSQGGIQQGPAVSLFVPAAPGSAGRWWPADLGIPGATGAQNNLRYAYFPAVRRLAVEINGQVTVYDTGDHQIGGVSQQQGMGASLTFTSQFGLVRLADLPVVVVGGMPPAETRVAVEEARPQPAPAEETAATIIATIERLAKLRQKNILSEEEFAAKKAELLSRL
jgi:hypothetical protein